MKRDGVHMYVVLTALEYGYIQLNMYLGVVWIVRPMKDWKRKVATKQI